MCALNDKKRSNLLYCREKRTLKECIQSALSDSMHSKKIEFVLAVTKYIRKKNQNKEKSHKAQFWSYQWHVMEQFAKLYNFDKNDVPKS